MKAAGKETKPRITEVRAGMASTSVNEGSRQRNQAKDYGRKSRNGVYFRKSEVPAKKSRQGLRKQEEKRRLLP